VITGCHRRGKPGKLRKGREIEIGHGNWEKSGETNLEFRNLLTIS